MVMPYFKKPGLAFTEQQRVRNLRIAIERGKLFIYYRFIYVYLTLIGMSYECLKKYSSLEPLFYNI